MSQEAINRATREAKRRRTLGEDAVCDICGWSEPTALTTTAGTTRCYECHDAARGSTTTEAHHVLGRDNDPTTIMLPGNQHRWLSDRQYDWPADLRSNPDRDPLLWIAQALQGLADYLSWWVASASGVARWLVLLAAALRERHGATWWTALGIPPLWEVIAP